jgi:hypothetical protein
MVAGEILDLLGLLVDDVGSMLKLAVNQLFVGLVNEGSKEEDGGREEGKTPEWDNLDEVVGDESTEESLYFVSRFTPFQEATYLTAAEARRFSAKTMR